MRLVRLPLLIIVIIPSSLFAADLTILHSFDGSDGANPFAGLTFDVSGNLYGTTYDGGSNNAGSVFKISPDTHAFNTLYSFTGSGSFGGLISDPTGNLYGTTYSGGSASHGTVFEILAGTNGSLVQLHIFTGGTDGANPESGLITDAAGNLYGTTSYGGNLKLFNGYGGGTVYEIEADSHHLTTLYSFNDGQDQSVPYSGLTSDADGNMYGTTWGGSGPGVGTVFEISAGSHQFSTLYSFNFNGSEGANPWGTLVSDAAGNLFGTTKTGGQNNDGTVFEISSGSHAFTLLHSFSGSDGANPWGGLAIDATGNLYGTTEAGGANGLGTVFEISAGSHAFSSVHSFSGSDGANPYSSLIVDAAGNLYGTTEAGGTNNDGTVFKLTLQQEPPPPSTITVSLAGFQASGVLGYSYNGAEVEYGSSGVFVLTTSNPMGALANLVSPTAYAFCDELTQNFTSTPELYNVGPPTDGNDPANALVGTINSFKEILLSELFSKFLDPSWYLPGPHTTTQITDAIAFHAAIEEIVHEAILSTADLSLLNLDTGLFKVESGYLLDHNDPSQLLPDVASRGQFFLDSLTGIDLHPKYQILQLTNSQYQDYLVAVAVPEENSSVLIGAVGLFLLAFGRQSLYKQCHSIVVG